MVPGLGNPKKAGSVESRWVTELKPATTYSMALKAADEVNNWSEISNIIEVQTLDEYPDYYRPLTTPANLVWNLQAAYNRKEFEPYLDLLAPEFIFKLQPGDALPGLGRDYWTFSEDSLGTLSLLTTGFVSQVEVDLTYGAAEPATEPGLVGTMKVRIEPTYLAVHDVGGETFIVNGDIQHMFFRRGEGGNSDRWYMVEWRDMPGPASSRRPLGPWSPTVVPSTWGRVKQHFAPH
jgi:hypothetical protein